jgi:hypothetical protein
LDRFLSAVRKYEDEIKKSREGLSGEDLGIFGEALGNLVDQIAQAIKPEVGVGFVACLVSATAGFFLSMLGNFPKKSVQVASPEVNQFSPDIIKSATRLSKFKNHGFTLKVRMPQRKYILIFISLVAVLAIFIIGFFIGNKSNLSKTSNSQESENSSTILKPSTKTLSPTQTPVEIGESPRLTSAQSKGKESANNSVPVNFEINPPSFSAIKGESKKLILTWSAAYDSDWKIILNYEYRFKGKGPYGEVFPCQYPSFEPVKGQLYTFSCSMDLSGISRDDFDELLNSGVIFDFQVRAITDSMKSAWSNPYSFDWSAHPEVAQ